MADVHGFGAKGDGVADDTAALQHALDDGDGVLRLGKGNYRITRPLVMDLTKRGYGAVRGEYGTSRITMAGAGPALRIVGDHQGSAKPSTVQNHTWERERFPTVSGLEIVGEHPQSVGVELVKTTKCVVSQVVVRQCRVGVHLVERNRDFILADSHLYDNHEIGLFFDRCNLHQIIVHGNHISWNKHAGIKSLAGDVHNLQIVGNDIEYNNITASFGDRDVPPEHSGGSEILFDATEGVISEVTIQGNTIQATVQTSGANIRVIGAAVERPQTADIDPSKKADTAHLITVTGNVLGSQWRAIELNHASRVTVTGNTIYDSADHSIWARRCSAIVISGNTISWRGVDTEPPKDGLRFEECDNVVVSGLAMQRCCSGSKERGAAITFVDCGECSVSDSQILDPRHRGIELENCRRCRIANNTILDRRKTATMQQAIRLIGESQNNLIAHNLVGYGVDEVLIALTEGNHSTGNIFVDK